MWDLICGINLNVVNAVKYFLGSKFELKDISDANVTLGVRIKQTPEGICPNHSH